MKTPWLRLALEGDRSGWLIAVMPEREPHVSAERLVVGDVYRNSRDGEPENWRAWLWPSAGGALPVTRSVDALDAPSPQRLLEKAQRRADKDGPWWGEAA